MAKSGNAEVGISVSHMPEAQGTAQEGVRCVRQAGEVRIIQKLQTTEGGVRDEDI